MYSVVLSRPLKREYQSVARSVFLQLKELLGVSLIEVGFILCTLLSCPGL